jgi:hypothetical protein
MGEVSGPLGTGGWPALRWLAARWLRRRWVAMVPLAITVAVGTAGTVLALATAHRTSTAYGDYLERANVGDLVINPSTNTAEIEQAIRTLPGVEQVTSHAFLQVSNDDGATRSPYELEESSETASVRGSPDGRYLDMDRPVVRSGRLPTGPNEAVVTADMADEFDLSVGDIEPLAFWRALPDLAEGDRFEELLSDVVEPIGVHQVTIVGIVTLADEVLPDELYPRQTVIVSPDLAARYDCVPPTAPPRSGFDDVIGTMFPPGCATQYRYYSLSFADGAAGVKPALDEFVRRSSALNEQLANSIDLDDVGVDEPPAYFLISSETAPEVRRVESAIRPTVTGLVVLGSAAGVAMLGLLALAVSRELRKTAPDRRQWYQLGVGTVSRSVAIGAPPAAGAVAGVVVGLATTSLIGIRSLGLVRVVDPGPVRLSALGVATTAALGALALVVVVLSVLAVRRADLTQTGGRRLLMPKLAARTAPPAAATGIRAAYGQRSAIPVIAGSAILTGALVAAAVFGASLSGLVSTPRSYGWPWDVAATTGGGYGDLDLAAARAALDDPDVEHWTALGFANELALDGEPMMTLIGLDQTSVVDLPLIEGELPKAHDEVAVGATTARGRDIDVGDRVEIGGAIARVQATVTGIVVFPSLGPLFAERVGTGTGLLVPEALIDEAEIVGGQSIGARDIATFVGVEMRDGAGSPAALARIGEKLEHLDALGFPAIAYPAPVRPPEIIDARSTRSVPVAVGVVLASVSAVGLLFASWASTRARRRELAVLRTLGFSGAQVRASVRVQSVATVLAALAIGVPLGAIAGRVLWRSFARQLGVVPDPASPWTPVLIVVVAGVALALVAAQLPAVLAARSTPAEGLRSE